MSVQQSVPFRGPDLLRSGTTRPCLSRASRSGIGVGVFHVKGWGAKSSACPSKAQAPGNQTFWRDVPGFLAGYPGGAGKV